MRAHKCMPLIRGTRYNIVCAIGVGGLCAVESYQSSNNSNTMMHWLRRRLLKNCGRGGPMNPFPGERSVLVLDNASYHHAEQEIYRRYCESVGVRVVFLPPYSPDLNPIEQLFSSAKHRIRRDYHQLSASAQPLDDLFEIFSDVATPENCQGWIGCSGY